MREDPLDHGRILTEKIYGRKIEFTSLGSETGQDADSYTEQQHRNFNRIRDDAKDRNLNGITGRIPEQDQWIRDSCERHLNNPSGLRSGSNESTVSVQQIAYVMARRLPPASTLS